MGRSLRLDSCRLMNRDVSLEGPRLMRLRVDQYYVVSHFQEVQVWSMTP